MDTRYGSQYCHLAGQDGVHVDQLDTAASDGFRTTSRCHALKLGHLVPPPHGSGPGEEALVIIDTSVIVSAVGAFEARDVNININHLDFPVLLQDSEVEDSSWRLKHSQRSTVSSHLCVLDTYFTESQ